MHKQQILDPLPVQRGVQEEAKMHTCRIFFEKNYHRNEVLCTRMCMKSSAYFHWSLQSSESSSDCNIISTIQLLFYHNNIILTQFCMHGITIIIYLLIMFDKTQVRHNLLHHYRRPHSIIMHSYNISLVTFQLINIASSPSRSSPSLSPRLTSLSLPSKSLLSPVSEQNIIQFMQTTTSFHLLYLVCSCHPSHFHHHCSLFPQSSYSLTYDL